MQTSRFLLGGLLSAALVAPSWAQDPEPGSVLVYPSVRELGASTVVSVTNAHPTLPVLLRFTYRGVLPGASGNPFIPDGCVQDYAIEFLTPNDTLTLNVACNNPLSPIDGYLLIDAVDPTTGESISFNYLVGSQFVAQGASATYSLAAISFQSPLPEGTPTDLDLGDDLDFDGNEYTTCPETLLIDTFLASVGNRLALLDLTAGPAYVVTVTFSSYNDNEFPLSVNHMFRCWFDRPLDQISALFSLPYLLNNTPHDPAEFDVDCDAVGDLETGWARLVSVSADDGLGSTISDPALLGAITGTTLGFERGRPLWRQGDNTNGYVSVFDPGPKQD